MAIIPVNDILYIGNILNSQLFKRKILPMVRYNPRMSSIKQSQRAWQNACKRSSLRSNLRQVPLDPSVPNTCPAEFLFKYKNPPVGGSYNTTAQTHQGTRVLSPYLSQTERHEQTRKAIRVNDVAHTRKVDKLGQEIKPKGTQLGSIFKNAANIIRRKWFPKSKLTLALGRANLDQMLPEPLNDETH